MKILPVLILLILMFHSGYARDKGAKLDFATVDRVTYRCYTERKWDSVIIVGKQALHDDIDYYYLRVRLGISYFEKHAYYPSITHLKKARKSNPTDPVVASYLYYAFSYTNQGEEAAMIKSFMSKEARNNIEESSGLLELVHAETGYTLSSDKNPSNLGTMMEDDSIYGERDLYGNNYYTSLALKFRLSDRISLNAAYSYLGFNKTTYFQYIRGETHLTSITDTSWGRMYNYSFPMVVHDTSFSYKVSQQEFHLGATIAAGNGFRIMPAFHYIHDAYAATTASYKVDTIWKPWYYTNFDDSTHLFPTTLLNYTYTTKDTSFSNYLFSMKVTKDLGLFSIGLAGSWSNLNGKKQKQAELSLSYFPFGNLNFYGTTTATGFFQGNKKRLLLSQVLGAKITSWMWAEGNIYYGDYTNANIFNGSVVYNNSDIIDYRAGASLIFIAGKHLHFSLIYQYMLKESQQVYYIKVQEPGSPKIKETQQTKTNPYFTNTIIGGITWKL